jgi:diguanylate cyclase (GGDEF)-like protein/PAS domain S-box-containing protein
MTAALVVLAGTLTVQYLVIGCLVVPRLSGLAEARGAALTIAKWGAGAFFVGCALTHAGLMISALTDRGSLPGMAPAIGGMTGHGSMAGMAAHAHAAMAMSGRRMLLEHVLPHLAQVVGGGAFIWIAFRRLDVRFTVKEFGAAERARARLASLVEHSEDAILAVNADGVLTAWNRGAELLFGRATADVIGRPMVALSPPEHRVEHETLLGKALAGHAVRHHETVGLRADGELIQIAVTLSAVPDTEGGLMGASAVIRDISEKQAQQQRLADLLDRERCAREAAEDARHKLEAAEARFRAAFEHAPIGVALMGTRPGVEGRFLQVNPALCAMTGYPRGELEQLTSGDISHPDALAEDAPAPRGLRQGRPGGFLREKRYRHADGHEIWVEVRASAVRDQDGDSDYNVVHIQDITDARRHEQELRHLADHDPLTGLVNRRRFEADLNATLARARTSREPTAVLVIDLDNFKGVNDAYGHAGGDAVLRDVARTLRKNVRAHDVIGRLGGDEFGIVLAQTSPESARRVAATLLQALDRDLVSSRPAKVTASIGVNVVDSDESLTADALLVEADVAMYDAKEAGRNRIAVASSGDLAADRGRARTRWARQVHDALRDDRFELWEQPILNLTTGLCDRSELLVRMLGDAGSVIPPASFLGIAERFGQVSAIDKWVVTHAVRLLAARQAAGCAQHLEINLSGASITDDTVLEHVLTEVASSSIDPRLLTFEITETAAIDNFGTAQRFSNQLTALGCELALDDFGTGFGSFYYLKHLPLHTVKIDGEFIQDLARSSEDRLTVRAIAEVLHGLNKRTIAERVADEATLQLLREYGIQHAQGFHIGRPQPARTLPYGAAAERESRPTPARGSSATHRIS